MLHTAHMSGGFHDTQMLFKDFEYNYFFVLLQASDASSEVSPGRSMLCSFTLLMSLSNFLAWFPSAHDHKIRLTDSVGRNAILSSGDHAGT